MKPLSRELANIAMRLEDRWIEQKGQTYGDAEYDAASKNLDAVFSEFMIWDDE